LTPPAVVVCGVVASDATSVWSSLWAKLLAVDANICVLVIDLTIAAPAWNKLTVDAFVLSRVVACWSAWFILNTAEDWAEEVVVVVVASVG